MLSDSGRENSPEMLMCFLLSLNDKNKSWGSPGQARAVGAAGLNPITITVMRQRSCFLDGCGPSSGEFALDPSLERSHYVWNSSQNQFTVLELDLGTSSCSLVHSWRFEVG